MIPRRHNHAPAPPSLHCKSPCQTVQDLLSRFNIGSRFHLTDTLNLPY